MTAIRMWASRAGQIGKARKPPQATFGCGVGAELKEKRSKRISLKEEGMSNRKSAGQKWVKPLSKLILDFGLAKGKSAVEFREGS